MKIQQNNEKLTKYNKDLGFKKVTEIIVFLLPIRGFIELI